MDQPESKYLPVSAVADRLGVSQSQVWVLVADKGFPEPHDLGGGVRHFLADEVGAWLSAGDGA